MDTKYYWEKGLFDSSYKLYTNNKLIGNLHDRAFSQTKDAEINGKQYSFRTSGFFKQHTQIFNQYNKQIGDIQYSSWMTKANINIENQFVLWKYDNIWNTKWSMNNSEGLKIESSNSTTSGQIISNSKNELFLLIGLFVPNYYKKMTIPIIIATLLPIWLTLFN